MANLDNYTVAYKNKQTGYPISNGSQIAGNFILEAVVSGSSAGVIESDVSIAITLKLNGAVETTSTVSPFTYSVTKLGDYLLTIVLTSAGKTKTFEFVFKDKETYTSLSTFKPLIINAITNKEIEKGSKILESTTAKPKLNTDLPIDLEIEEYKLTRNGLTIGYDPMYDVIKDDGKYTIDIKVRRKEGFPAGDAANKTFSTDFIMEEDEMDLSNLFISIVNDINNVEIPDTRIYVDENIIINWNSPEKVDIQPVLTFHAEAKKMDDEYLSKLESVVIGDFERGVTILNRYGVYTLTLKLVDSGNNKNTLTITRRFMIIRKPLTLTSDKILFENALTGLRFESGASFYSNEGVVVQGLYNAFTDERTAMEEVLLKRKDSVSDEWDEMLFVNGVTPLHEPGDYKITIKVRELNDDLNKIEKTISFDIKPSPVNLQKLEILLKNRATGGENVLNGATYTIPETNEHPFLPDWNTLKGCTITCTFKLSSSSRDFILSKPEDFEKLIPRPTTGEYVFNLKASDNNYPTENFITKWFVFNIITEDITSAVGDYYKVYIDGVEKVLNSSGYRLDAPGNYNVLAVRKNPHNFKYSISEVNFKILQDDMVQRALILSEPPQRVKASSVKVFIEYPSYALSREYSVNHGSWMSYEGLDKVPSIYVKNGTFIYARYKDPNNNATITSDRFDINNIDEDAANFELSDIIGVTNDKTYYSVTPEVKRKYKFKYVVKLRRGDVGSSLSLVEGYKLGEAIRASKNKLEECQLEITAINTNNGNKDTEIVNFRLNGITPKKILLGGFLNNQIQSTATPSIANSADYPLNSYKIEAYLNNRPALFFAQTNPSKPDEFTYKLLEPITKAGNYKLSVSAVNNANGLREVSVGHFIINNSEVIPGRLALKPLKSSALKTISAYDGELITIETGGVLTGDVGIFRDGMVLNKVRDLSIQIDTLNEEVLDIEVDMAMNKSRTESLKYLKQELYNKIMYLNKETRDLSILTDLMEDTIVNIEIPAIDDVINQKPEKSDILTQSKLNSRILNTMLTKIEKMPPQMSQVIDNLQYNASYIGELKHLASRYNDGYK